MSIRQVSLRAALAGVVVWPAAAAAPAHCYRSAAVAAAAAAAAVRQFTD